MSDTYAIDAIVEARQRGLDFDLVRQLFVDDEDIAKNLTLRVLAGAVNLKELYGLDKLAFVYLAYYSPELIGFEEEE